MQRGGHSRLSRGKLRKFPAELRDKRIIETKAHIGGKVTYGGLDEVEGCHDGQDSHEVVKAEHHVGVLREPILGGVHLSAPSSVKLCSILHLPLRDLDHTLNVLKVLRFESGCKDGEEETGDQAGDEVDQSNHQGPHLHWVIWIDGNRDIAGYCEIVEDADDEDYLEGAAAAEVREDRTLAHRQRSSRQRGFRRRGK